MRGGGGIRLGSVAGVPVSLAPSWFVIAAVVTLLYSGVVARFTGPGLPAFAGAFAFAVLLALSVLVHEAAHAVAARAYGLQVDGIVVDLWGGHTSLGAPRSPLQSAVVAAVAPLSNVALAGVLAVVASVADASGLPGFLLDAVILSNLLVGAFNLLPGLPLDGGRVLEAAVWALSRDRDLATVVAGWGGRVVVLATAAFFLVRPLLEGGRPSLFTLVWIVLVGAVLWRAAGEAIAVGGARRRLRRVDLAGLTRRVLAVPAAASVAAWRQARGAPGPSAAVDGPVAVLVDADGRPVAVVDPEAERLVPDAEAGTTPLSAVSVRLGAGAVAPRGSGALEVAGVLSRAGGPGVVLVGEAPDGSHDGSPDGGLAGGSSTAGTSGSPPPRAPEGWVPGPALARALQGAR